MKTQSMSDWHVVHFLRMQPWMEMLPDAMREEVFEACQSLRAPPGETMLPAGSTSQGWYAVLSGCVKLQSPFMGERGSAFLALSGGEWFGEGSVMSQAPRGYEVVALRHSELLCLPRETFDKLMATSLPFAHAVLGHMNTRLSQAMAIIECERLGRLDQRLALYLSRAFSNGMRRINLSQAELGTLAGMSRQAANRALRLLEERGLVSLKLGRVTSVDHKGVEELLPRRNFIQYGHGDALSGKTVPVPACDADSPRQSSPTPSWSAPPYIEHTGQKRSHLADAPAVQQ